MTNPQGLQIAVIGAGVSGLACASHLSDHGLTVRLYDKGRGPGGRTSTRRVEVSGVEVGFDHGAQYFTVRDPVLAERVAEWERIGVVRRWEGRIAVLGEAGKVESYSSKPRYVGTPSMSAICQHLSSGQDVRCGVTVSRVDSDGHGVTLVDRDGDLLGEFDVAVSTAPPAQTAAMIAEAAPTVAGQAASVEMRPCWAVMAAFDARLDVPYDGAFVNRGPLSWVARTSSKPGRRAEPDRWVLHADAQWSRQRIGAVPEEVTAQLLEAAAESMGRRHVVKPLWAGSHRWRYALADEPLEEGCLFDASARIGACGDWAHGNRIEGAFLSGLAMAQQVLKAS
jgi:renalase